MLWTLFQTPSGIRRSTPFSWRRSLLGASAAVLLLSGCSVPADPPPSAPPALPERFSTSGTLKLEPQWWHAYDDNQLNRLVGEALASNHSLQATWERLEQARAAADKSGAERYPELNLEGGASTEKLYAETTTTTERFSMGLAASYEIDLWGAVDAAADAARFDLEASKESLRTAAVTLSAEVTAAWFDLQSQHRQARLLEQQITLNEKHLALTERKFRSGQAKASDVLQQRQSLESTRGELLLVQKNISLYEHKLALLCGRAPGTAAYPVSATLPRVGSLPLGGVPSELLMQRPDVKAAYLSLQAADRRLAAAIAQRYPRLTLSASLQSNASSAKDLFNDWLATLAANLVAPLFDGGARKAEADRTEALRNEQFYTYSQTLLEALGEVEDALSEVSHRQRYLESLEKQIELSAASVAQLREQYLKGSGSFVAFLNAQLSHESLERSRVTASNELLNQTVSLYRALSTGWEPQRYEPISRSQDVR